MRLGQILKRTPLRTTKARITAYLFRGSTPIHNRPFQNATMSWMDSWSRPSKHAAVPPPLYLTAGEDVPYCHTCGRVMNSRKSNKNNNNVVKYCSDRCRNRKPGPIDKKIERTIVALLNGEEDSGVEKTDAGKRIVKGDHRIVVTCDEIEELVFGKRGDPAKVFGRRKNRASRVIGGKEGEWKSVDMEDDDDDDDDDESDDDGEEGVRHVTGGGKPGPNIRPPQVESDVNFSVGGERGWAERVEESAADLEKKAEGQKKAEEREMVRRAARRGVVFGFLTNKPVAESVPTSKRSKHKEVKADEGGKDDDQVRKKCEALMNGSIVEPSFAKGNWSVRWREA